LKRFELFTEFHGGKLEKKSFLPSVYFAPLRLRFNFLLPVICIFVLFASCASAPKSAPPIYERNRELSLLPAGARVYLWADAVKGRPLLELFSFGGRSGKDAAVFLDRTESAAAAVFQEGGGRRFFLAASGAYPLFKANFSLTFSKGWKKLKSVAGNRYWYSENDKLALALGSNLVLVSDADPFENFQAEIPPQGFNEFNSGLALAGWMKNPSVSINSFLDSLGIPLQIPAEEFFFGAEQTLSRPEPWELIFRIKTSSAAQARSLLSLFSVARLFVMRGAASGSEENASSISLQEAAVLLFTNIPDLDEDLLTIRTSSLHENRIALLFEMFSLYSN
jgi:hypothetical protein